MSQHFAQRRLEHLLPHLYPRAVVLEVVLFAQTAQGIILQQSDLVHVQKLRQSLANVTLVWLFALLDMQVQLLADFLCHLELKKIVQLLLNP